ncbi:MAG: hypothetical protein IKD72_02135 [Clostridia bacterium]|nr:hypothetical protein [Clostridia bacterium]
MRILYIITKILTFPGAYLRAFWEHLTCRILKLPVEREGYLHLDETCGHVEHGMASRKFAAYLIETGPGFMNFITGLPLFLCGLIQLRILGVRMNDNTALFFVYIAALYLGASLLCSLFPMVEDALNAHFLIYQAPGKNPLGMVFAALPHFIALIGAYLEKYGVPFLLVAGYLVYTFLHA